MVLSIQFEKRRKPRFVLNLSVEPPGGAEAIIANGRISTQGRVKPRLGGGTASWFRADPSLWQKVFGLPLTREKEAVDQALSFLDTIENWFRDSRASPAIRTITFDWRAHQKPGKNG
jgi:hypothetical protein